MVVAQMDNQQIFEKIVNQLMSNWTALQLAVEHSLAGLRTQEFYENLIEEVINIFNVYKTEVQVSDLNENFLDFFNEVFNMDVEDGSTSQVGMLLKEAYTATFVEGTGMQYYEKLISKGKSNSKNLSIVQGDEDFSGDEDSTVNTNDMDVEMGNASTSTTEPPRPRRQPKERIIDEDGWETVTSSRRRR